MSNNSCAHTHKIKEFYQENSTLVIICVTAFISFLLAILVITDGINFVPPAVTGIVGIAVGWHFKNTEIKQKELELKISLKKIQVEAITHARQAWLNEVRDHVSHITGRLTNVIYYASNKLGSTPDLEELIKKLDENMDEIYLKNAKLELLLNPTEKAAINFPRLLKSIEENITKLHSSKRNKKEIEDACKEALDEITKITQELIKTEWERIKKEAGGDLENNKPSVKDEP